MCASVGKCWQVSGSVEVSRVRKELTKVQGKCLQVWQVSSSVWQCILGSPSVKASRVRVEQLNAEGKCW